MKQDTPHPHPSLFETAIADLTDAEKQKVQILFDALRDELADKIYETLRDDDTNDRANEIIVYYDTITNIM